MRGSLLHRLWIGLIPLAMACSSSTEIRVSGGATLDAQADSIMVPAADAVVADAGVPDASPPSRNPSEMGGYTVENRSLRVSVGDDDQTIGVELFLPEGMDDFPLVIFTRGLVVGSDGYRGLAGYAASHGFAVGFPIFECSFGQCPIATRANESIQVAEALGGILSRETPSRRITSVGYMGHGVGASIAIAAGSATPVGQAVLVLMPNNLSDYSGGWTGPPVYNDEYPDLRDRIPGLESAGLFGAPSAGSPVEPAEKGSERLARSVRELPRHVHWRWLEPDIAWMDVLSDPSVCVESCLMSYGPTSPNYDEVQRSIKTLMVAFFAQALLGEDMEAWLNPEDPDMMNSFEWSPEGG